MTDTQLERDPAAHAVADHVRPVDAQGVQQADDPACEESGVVRRERLVGVAESGEVERDRPPIGRESGDRREKRDLRAAKPVEHHHRPPDAGLHRGDPAVSRAHAREFEATLVLGS